MTHAVGSEAGFILKRINRTVDNGDGSLKTKLEQRRLSKGTREKEEGKEERRYLLYTFYLKK